MQKLLVVGLLFMLAGIPAASADGTAPHAEITALYADWRRAVETANVEEYRAVLADDVRLIPPGAAVIEGAANYEKFLGPVFAAADYVIEVVEPPRVEVIGNLAIAEYRYVIHLTMKDPAGTINQAGALNAAKSDVRYFDVLKKDDAGNWKVWRHSWQAM